ncbi:MAG: HAD family hydrolase [Clostridia bacterium]|nr:HAD family hydrolase [Clostridia bacterium]
MKKYNYILWDFNGTILDDVQTGIDSVNVLLSDRGLPIIPSKEVYRAVFGFPIRDYYGRLGFDFSKEPYEKVAVEWVNQYLSRVQEAPLCPGVFEALNFFREQKIPQSILSATKLEMLQGQLQNLGIRTYFEEVMGLDNIYATSKEALALSWKERHFDVEAVMIGDTVHDYEVAQAMGIDCVLISGGHQPVDVLEKCGCPVCANLHDFYTRF